MVLYSAWPNSIEEEEKAGLCDAKPLMRRPFANNMIQSVRRGVFEHNVEPGAAEPILVLE